jgi:hypothetical protein
MHDNNINIIEKDNSSMTENELENFYNELCNYSENSSDNNSINESNDYQEIFLIYYSELNELNMKQIQHILNYYNIKRSKNKEQTIYSIIDFECKEENLFIVNKRKEYWNYIETLKKDKYLSKYINI